MAKLNKKTKIAALTAALVVGATGTAFAYWTMTGAGTGAGTTGTTVAVVVNQTSTVAGLYPGGPAANLSGDFTNDNAGPVTVKAVTATVTGTNIEGCDKGWYAIGGADSVSTHTLDASNPVVTRVGAWSGLTVSLTNVVDTNQDACKNATITITYDLAE